MRGLIAIHGQHDNQSLMDSATHLGVLDAFAQSEQAHARYYAAYKELCHVKRHIDALNIDEEAKNRRAAELRDTVEELELAQLSTRGRRGTDAPPEADAECGQILSRGLALRIRP